MKAPGGDTLLFRMDGAPLEAPSPGVTDAARSARHAHHEPPRAPPPAAPPSAAGRRAASPPPSQEAASAADACESPPAIPAAAPSAGETRLKAAAGTVVAADLDDVSGMLHAGGSAGGTVTPASGHCAAADSTSPTLLTAGLRELESGHDRPSEGGLTAGVPSGDTDAAGSEPAGTAADAPRTARRDDTGRELKIDLLSTLKLAGANNLDIRLAAERVAQAQAEYRLARVLWLPSLNAGVGYTKHEGQIQATSGRVLDVSRNAFFVGGGASFGGTPLAGAAGGPARLMVQLDLSDAIFRPLAARQSLQAARSLDDAAQWDRRHEAMTLYFELLAADGLLAVARRHAELAEQLLKHTASLVRAGKADASELARVRAAHAEQLAALAEFRQHRDTAEAALVRHLHLDADTRLRPATNELLPLSWAPQRLDRSALVAAAWEHRPDLRAQAHRISAERHKWTGERWRPLIPNVYAAASAGAFGGGVGARFPQADGRADFDVGAVWELKHLGFGNAARREIAHRELHRSQLSFERQRDEIGRAVVEAVARIEAARERLDLARRRAEDAYRAFELTLQRMQHLRALPLEAVQALHVVVEAESDAVRLIAEYNVAQIELERLVGVPLDRLRAEEESEPAPASEEGR